MYMQYHSLIIHSPTISHLLAMSEHHLHQSPPLVSESVRALLAVLTMSPSTRVEAQVRLQLGLVLYHHTNNVVESRQNLDRAVSVSVGVHLLYILYVRVWLCVVVLSCVLTVHVTSRLDRQKFRLYYCVACFPSRCLSLSRLATFVTSLLRPRRWQCVSW